MKSIDKIFCQRRFYLLNNSVTFLIFDILFSFIAYTKSSETVK